jgi:hypothetical protein
MLGWRASALVLDLEDLHVDGQVFDSKAIPGRSAGDKQATDCYAADLGSYVRAC